MPIDKIGSTESYAAVKRSFAKPKPQLRQIEQDTISLTQIARQNAELLRIHDLAMAAPDIRIEKVQALRDKLQTPSYPDPAIIASLADRLSELFYFSNP